MTTSIGKPALDQLFHDARTHSHWQHRPVPDSLLHQLYDLLRQGPTSANTSPARFVFVSSPEGKAKLVPCMAEGNQEKTLLAPVTVIVGMDLDFASQLPHLFPHTDAEAWFKGNQQLIEDTAFRNSSLQGAYLMMAARALGLDCGPMSGFDAAKVDTAFFPNSLVRSNFIINLGYGEASRLHHRLPRLDFDEACRIL